MWQIGAVLFELLDENLFDTEDFMDGELNFSRDVSDECRDFLSACLQTEKKRLELSQLLSHPWFRF